MIRSKSILFFSLTFLAISCGNFEEISIGDIYGIKLKGFSGNDVLMEFSLSVDNPTSHRITISEIDLRLGINSQYVGKISLDEKLIIAANSKMVHPVAVKVRLANFLGAGIMMMNLQKGQKVMFRLEGVVTARSLLMKRKIRVDENREIII